MKPSSKKQESSKTSPTSYTKSQKSSPKDSMTLAPSFSGISSSTTFEETNNRIKITEQSSTNISQSMHSLDDFIMANDGIEYIFDFTSSQIDNDDVFDIFEDLTKEQEYQMIEREENYCTAIKQVKTGSVLSKINITEWITGTSSTSKAPSAIKIVVSKIIHDRKERKIARIKGLSGLVKEIRIFIQKFKERMTHYLPEDSQKFVNCFLYDIDPQSQTKKSAQLSDPYHLEISTFYVIQKILSNDIYEIGGIAQSILKDYMNSFQNIEESVGLIPQPINNATKIVNEIYFWFSNVNQEENNGKKLPNTQLKKKSSSQKLENSQEEKNAEKSDKIKSIPLHESMNQFIRISIEKYVFQKLTYPIVDIYKMKNEESDSIFLSKRAKIFEKYSTRQILDEISLSEKFWAVSKDRYKDLDHVHNRKQTKSLILMAGPCCAELQKIALTTNPRQKIKYMQLAYTSLKTFYYDFSKHKYQLSSMEDIIPVLIMVVLLTNVDNFRTELDIMGDFIECDPYEMESEKRLYINLSDRVMQTATVRHILPKANEIVDTAQADFKSAYPFELRKMKHVADLPDPDSGSGFQYSKETYCNTFKPVKKSVKEHFAQKYLVYDKFNNNFDEEIFNVNIFSIQRLKNLRNNDFIINLDEAPEYSLKDQENLLVFDSRFECGNLSLVSKIDHHFFLLLHNDVNTSGYTNWFYFSVEPKKLGKYKLAIMNYGKAGWAFGLGTGVCYKEGDGVWKRGAENIFCQPNAKIFSENDPFRGFNTLSFEFEFKTFEKVYFSYNIPYSYTDLLTTLDEIERQNYSYYHRKLAGTSICGNRIQMLTIGNFQKHKSAQSAQQIPAIVLLARSHPGETVSSWVLHFFLKFILSNDIQARILRDKFIFKIFPMINPDGVIHGNYRCSLIGRDLNRRWNKAIKELYPEVYYVKNQILELSQKKIIKLVVDLHGHTQKRQAFFFGCNDKSQPHKCRLFPYLLSKLSTSFDFGSANFSIDRGKLSTARVTLFMLLKNCDVFTLETSQFGLRFDVFYKGLFKELGESLGKGIFFYFKLNKFVHIYLKNDQRQQKSNAEMNKLISNQKNNIQSELNLSKNLDGQAESDSLQNLIDADRLQKEILENTNILKFGNDKDDGSDSEPSVCNINFDNLNKMCNRKELMINSYAKNQTKRNVNRVLVANKRLEMNKKSIDLLPIGNNKMLPVPQRFASTSHSFRKNSEDSSADHSQLARTMSKFPGKKSSSQRGISTPSINGRNMKNGNAQQIVKMINFELSFDGFTSQREGTKRKLRSTNNDILNKILDVRLNSFVNYTQPALARPYSFLYKNKKSRESRK